MKVSAKTKERPTPIVVEVDIPTGLQEKLKKFGDEVINAAVEDSLIITVQSLIRRLMTDVKDKAGKVKRGALTAAQIQTEIAKWQPSVRSLVRQSAFEKASSSLDKLSPEERKALLSKLQGMK